MRAEAISSSGMVSMYWRRRKTPVGVAAPGMITPHKLLFQPIPVITRKTGTRMTEMGIINVLMMSRKMNVLPRNSYLARANAAMLLISSVMIVAATVTMMLLRR